MSTSNVHDLDMPSLGDGSIRFSEFRGDALLVVNVASKCGLTPQYAGLQALYERYRERGFSIVGVPCNQFAGQEPGTSDEIRDFCTTNYHVTFPLTERVEVNGPNRHALYELLVEASDAGGEAGDVQWNFEKFLIGADGTAVARFRPGTAPEDDVLTDAIEAALPRWRDVPAGEVRVGDLVRTETGERILVQEIQDRFLGRAEMLALIGDRNGSWYKRPLPRDATVGVLER